MLSSQEQALCGTMLSAAPFLALSESDSPMLLWLIIGGLMAIGPVIKSYIEIYQWFRGKGIDTSDFVTRRELAIIKGERDTQIASTITEIRSDLDKLEKFMQELNRDLPAIHRALGRLEGHDDAITPKRPR